MSDNQFSYDLDIVIRIVDMWHDSQMGHIDDVRKKESEFADLMWEIKGDIYGE